MKNIILSLALAALACGTSIAQQPEATVPTPPPAVVNVGEELQKLEFLNDVRPAADAKFYVYLCSASWCPPCRATMPGIVKEYANIKAAGGEIILLCFDRTPQAGAAYVKNYKIGFAAIMTDFNKMPTLKMPGFFPPRGIPNISIVSADGKVLYRGHGENLLKWKEILKGKI